MKLEGDQPIRLTVGHTPDADDAYMFYAMVEGKIDLRGLLIEHEIADLQSLNRKAQEGVHEVTAMSFFAYGELYRRYRPLGPGVSYGHGYGPRIIAQTGFEVERLRDGTLAVPGMLTTAALLAREFGWRGRFLEVPYTETLQALREGRADAALLIHEEQLLFEKRGLELVVDLGAWWAERNAGLPLPLGVNAVRRDVPEEVACRYAHVFQDSIAYALEHREEALTYAMRFARQADRGTTRDFVGMYVNASTLDISPEALESVLRLFLLMPAGGEISTDFIVVDVD